jgi:dTDP-4-amino-4,6-dideoxygalactose transaminase
MTKAIASIPHQIRVDTHRVDYIKSINAALNYPFQSEDGRQPSPFHIQLENKCREYTGINNWQFTNCCTDALQIAFHALCKAGDTVIVPAYGWRAIVNAPWFVGMNVLFCDIDSSGNIDLQQMQEMIKQHKPKAILIVHNFGAVIDFTEIVSTCRTYGVKIIEDAAPSFTMGEPYSYKLGSLSDIVCFSFDFTKSPGCLGAGGAIATNDSYIANRIKTICSHTTESNFIGTKSYLDTTSAAVLLKDIELIEVNNYRAKRRAVADFYKSNLPFEILKGNNYIHHRFIIFPKDKQQVLSLFNSKKILAKSVFEANTKNCTMAAKFSETAVELPCHHFIDIDDLQERIKGLAWKS